MKTGYEPKLLTSAPFLSFMISCLPVKTCSRSQRIDDFPVQRKLPCVSPRLCYLLIALALIAPLRAQDQPIHMRPEFPLSFPLTQNGDDVSVKYPILVNPYTVLKPGMVMRTMYVLSIDSQNTSTDLVIAHKGNADAAYARGSPGSDSGPKMDPALAHEIEGYRRTVWQVANNFILAMAQLPTDQMHLIYSTSGKDQGSDLHDEHFIFFDGLFVGLPDGKVTVIAVEKESKAESAGIKAGDVIDSVGGIPTQDNLLAFASAYATAKKTATENEVASYPIVVRPGGTGGPVQRNVAMPPSLKGGLMDGFDSQLGPTPQPAPAKPATPY